MSETANVKIHCGTKFFRFDDNKLEIIRVTKVDENNLVSYITEDKGKKSIDLDDLLAAYKRLAPDGMMIVSVVFTEKVRDVIIALKNLKNVNTLPDVVCRQGIFDLFSSIANRDEDNMYVGMSVSQATCPVDINFEDVLSCTSKEEGSETPVLVYIDDTLDDILSLFNRKKYNDAIKECSESLIQNFATKNVFGITNSLRELLEYNNFMYDFRKCFGIMEIPFHIDEESDQLSQENIIFLENEFKVNIMETYVMPYSKEINLKAIKRDYILVSSAADKFNKLYICGYDTADGKYIPR